MASDRFGELLTAEKAWKLINGEIASKGSAIGKHRVKELMASGEIRAVAMGNTRGKRQSVILLTRPQYVEEWLKGLFLNGNKTLDIVPIPHANA